MTPEQLKAQNDFSDKRKAFLDNKYKKDQEEQARQAKIKAKEDARQKRKEERDAKIKAAQEAKDRLAQAQAEKAAQEKKHREEYMRQQEQEREEKIKQDEILRQETSAGKNRNVRSVNVRPNWNPSVKRSVSNWKMVWRPCIGCPEFYQQGEFTAAAERFKDVQDILPGYKHSEQYMDEARQKSLNVNSQTVISSEASENTPVLTGIPSGQCSKALDLFDTNAK